MYVRYKDYSQLMQNVQEMNHDFNVSMTRVPQSEYNIHSENSAPMAQRFGHRAICHSKPV